jgi:hypothetical protein
MRLRQLLLCSVVLTAGCGTGLMHDPLEVMRDANKQKIAQLSVGMSRGEVEKAVMGNDVAGGKIFDVLFGRFQYLDARNPMREERVRGADGADYEVLFYYTDLRERDNKITDDELTPVVFRDGRIVGIGYDYLGERVPKYKGIR